MINWKLVKLDVREMLDGCLLVEAPKEIMAYEDGKPTGKVGAIGYTVLLPKCEYEKMPVKVPCGATMIDFNGTPVRVEFKNPQGKLWYDYTAKEVKMSLTADSIEAVTPNKLKVSKTEEV